MDKFTPDQMREMADCRANGEPVEPVDECLLVAADRIEELQARAEAAEAELSQYKTALAYAAIVVDQVAQNEDVEANSLMAALLEIEAVLPKIEEQADE